MPVSRKQLGIRLGQFVGRSGHSTLVAAEIQDEINDVSHVYDRENFLYVGGVQEDWLGERQRAVIFTTGEN